MSRQPREVKSVWDNGGRTADRYTVVLRDRDDEGYYTAFALSDDPGSPQGVSMVVSVTEGSHIGQRISWNTLPTRIQDHVRDRLGETMSGSPNPRRSRSQYKHERLASMRGIDPRSIRTVTPRPGVRLRIGCPKGEWSPSAQRCRVGTRAVSMLKEKNVPGRILIEDTRRPKLRVLRRASRQNPLGETLMIAGANPIQRVPRIAAMPGRTWYEKLSEHRRRYPQMYIAGLDEPKRKRKKKQRATRRNCPHATISAEAGAQWYVGLMAGKTRGKVFTSVGIPTHGTYPEFEQVVGPFRNLDHIRQYGQTQRITLTNAPRRNPPARGPVEIYGSIDAIEATKGRASLWPGEHFRHDFRGRGARILGLPNGDLLVKKGKKGRLWNVFDYD